MGGTFRLENGRKVLVKSRLFVKYLNDQFKAKEVANAVYLHSGNAAHIHDDFPVVVVDGFFTIRESDAANHPDIGL